MHQMIILCKWIQQEARTFYHIAVAEEESPAVSSLLKNRKTPREGYKNFPRSLLNPVGPVPSPARFSTGY